MLEFEYLYNKLEIYSLNGSLVSANTELNATIGLHKKTSFKSGSLPGKGYDKKRLFVYRKAGSEMI
ncbi:hypothetical protein D5R40_32655 [Okeania hirsuta]|uniref:Uncharacterized protein n=1 Tax=Okeania hirsuta TaxID=1458930 RepID=A0A3N6PTG5_9CYAN|nr:hypothetical protein D5R40_32655 [Okeania hirsuta]